MANRFGGAVGSGVMVAALASSAVFKVLVFRAICPMGIATRGTLNLVSLTKITGKILPIIIELWTIPLIAVIASLRERRFWCNKLCPVGVTLNLAGAVSPLLKPRVKNEKCVIKGCPKDCQDYKLDYCLWCRVDDARKCENVCPSNINLLDKGSLSKCTKCLECYIVCNDRKAIEIKLYEKPDFRASVSKFFKRKKTGVNSKLFTMPRPPSEELQRKGLALTQVSKLLSIRKIPTKFQESKNKTHPK